MRKELQLPVDTHWNFGQIRKSKHKARRELTMYQKKAEFLRDAHLQSLADDASQRLDIPLQTALKCIRQSEQQTLLFQKLQNMYKQTQNGAISRLLCPDSTDPNYKIPKKCNTWTEIHEEDEICKILLEQNKENLLGANLTPLAQERLKKMLGPFGLTPECDRLLDGTADLNKWTTDPILQAWLKNWQHTPESKASPPINLDLTCKEWCNVVKHAKEK